MRGAEEMREAAARGQAALEEVAWGRRRVALVAASKRCRALSLILAFSSLSPLTAVPHQFLRSWHHMDTIRRGATPSPLPPHDITSVAL